MMRHLLTACIVLTLSCRGGHSPGAYRPATGGDVDRGSRVIDAYGCGACHTIPGVHAAVGVVAPPLTMFGRRTFIAGEVPNTPANLARWIREPQSIEPRTAMPALGLTQQQAQDAAAYLEQLQ